MARTILPTLLLLTACPSATDSGGTVDPCLYTCCASTAALTVPASPLRGDVSFAFTLVNPDAEVADVRLSLDPTSEGTWRSMTLEGETVQLATTPEGKTYNVLWRSASDLPDDAWPSAAVKLVASSDCGVWPLTLQEGVSVDNTVDTSCSISVGTPSGAMEGAVTIPFEVAQPDGAEVFVAARWSVDGESWENTALLPSDCDGDGADDGLTHIATSADGEAHCFVWDTQEDIVTDQEVTVELACGTGFQEEASDRSEPFVVRNDPTPDAGEVVITEVMPFSGLAYGNYFEIHSLAGHVLNLQDVVVNRYAADDWTGRDVTSTFTLSSPSDSVLLYPGAYLVFAGSYDENANGCIEPSATWPSSFTLATDSVLEMTRSGVKLLSFDYRNSAGWSFSERYAWSLGPSHYGDDAPYTVGSWCKETTSIPTCEDDVRTGYGTPGLLTGSCL